MQGWDGGGETLRPEPGARSVARALCMWGVRAQETEKPSLPRGPAGLSLPCLPLRGAMISMLGLSPSLPAPSPACPPPPGNTGKPRPSGEDGIPVHTCQTRTRRAHRPPQLCRLPPKVVQWLGVSVPPSPRPPEPQQRAHWALGVCRGRYEEAPDGQVSVGRRGIRTQTRGMGLLWPQPGEACESLRATGLRGTQSGPVRGRAAFRVRTGHGVSVHPPKGSGCCPFPAVRSRAAGTLCGCVCDTGLHLAGAAPRCPAEPAGAAGSL